MLILSIGDDDADGYQQKCQRIIYVENIFTQQDPPEYTGKQRLGKFDDEKSGQVFFLDV